MKKIIIGYWHGKKYDDLGYPHHQEYEYSAKLGNQIIDKILNAGYSVMLRHDTIDNELIIWIDKGRFGQK